MNYVLIKTNFDVIFVSVVVVPVMMKVEIQVSQDSVAT